MQSKLINHRIKRHIIDTLTFVPSARFSDMRPPKTDTNLFSYHLNALVKAGLVEKIDGGYRLSLDGLNLVDQSGLTKFGTPLAHQPKVITMLVIQNENGDILLQKRPKQPYVDTWTLPYGKVHIEDKSVLAAARREAFEKLGLENPDLEHAGDCYIRVWAGGRHLSTTLAHVFRAYREYSPAHEGLIWARPHRLSDYNLAPAVEEIMARTFFRDPFYFEEFDINWG